MATSSGVTGPFEENSSLYGGSNMSSEDDDVVMDDQSQSTTKPRMNISFLCNPNDEEPGLRQQSVPALIGDNLGSVQNRSWAKDSTCEQVHFTKPN
jgi:hypothetical protein